MSAPARSSPTRLKKPAELLRESPSAVPAMATDWDMGNLCLTLRFLSGNRKATISCLAVRFLGRSPAQKFNGRTVISVGFAALDTLAVD